MIRAQLLAFVTGPAPSAAPPPHSHQRTSEQLKMILTSRGPNQYNLWTEISLISHRD